MRVHSGFAIGAFAMRRGSRRKALRYIATTFLVCVSISTSSLAQNISRLDVLLQSADTPELVRELRSAPRMSTELEAWLRTRAEEGHAVPQYELAMRIGKSNLDETLKWSARARMARILDASECASSDYAVRLGWVLDQAYRELDGIARDGETKFAVAVNDALAWDASRRSWPDPRWICGERGTIPDSNKPIALSRQADRKRARESLEVRAREMSERQRLREQLDRGETFEVRETPLIGYPLKWLDDQRLYILVETHGGAAEAEKLLVPNSRNVIWNVDTNSVEAARTIESGFCYYRGFVGYLGFSDGRRSFFEGPWGEAKEVMQRLISIGGRALPDDQQLYVEPSGRTWPASTYFYFNPFSCRLTRGQYITSKGLKWPLGDGDGYITVEQDGNKLTYYPEGDREGSPVALPLRFSDIQNGVYSQALSAYFFPRELFSRSSTSPLEVWILDRAGQLRMEIVPAGPWFSASKGILASRVGIVLWSHNRSGTGDGFAGVYLNRNGKMLRVLQGFPHRTEISPDGCRIAATLGRPGRVKQLRVVDVCKGKS